MKLKTTCIMVFAFLLFGCTQKLSEEIKFFGDYDLDNGTYKLIGFGLEGGWIEDYSDFYIDDIETLKKMQKKWVFKYKSKVMACGYGYKLMFVDEELILNTKLVNIDCEYMNGWIYFPENYLSDYKSSFKRMSEFEKEEFSRRYIEK